MPTTSTYHPIPDSYGTGQVQLGTTLPPHRLFRWSGAPPIAALCSSGQDADGVSYPQYHNGPPDPTLRDSQYGVQGVAGRVVWVESGGVFAVGANLQSDGIGRAIAHAGGPIVLRALEASPIAGTVVWACFASGR